MPRERKWARELDISGNRLNELIAFSKQYNEKKARIKSESYISATVCTGTPSAHSNSSPVERIAERCQKEKADTELIEHCVKVACSMQEGLYPYILKAVTNDITYEHLGPPCCRNTYYQYCRRYFILLDREQKKIKEWYCNNNKKSTIDSVDNIE